ncbi:hypothetical protein L0F63_005662, partial [Massospora cicadina]
CLSCGGLPYIYLPKAGDFNTTISRVRDSYPPAAKERPGSSRLQDFLRLSGFIDALPPFAPSPLLNNPFTKEKLSMTIRETLTSPPPHLLDHKARWAVTKEGITRLAPETKGEARIKHLERTASLRPFPDGWKTGKRPRKHSAWSSLQEERAANFTTSRYYAQWERPTRFFFQKQKARSTAQDITSLKIGTTTTSDKEEITQELHRFYSSLFHATQVDPSDIKTSCGRLRAAH